MKKYILNTQIILKFTIYLHKKSNFHEKLLISIFCNFFPKKVLYITQAGNTYFRAGEANEIRV